MKSTRPPARDYSEGGEHAQTGQLLYQPLAVAEAAPDRDDASIADFLINRARKRKKLSGFVADESTYQRAEELSQKTDCEQHSSVAIRRVCRFWTIRP